MVLKARPVKGGPDVQVGGYNLELLWQELGGGLARELTFGLSDLNRLRAMTDEHPSAETIARMIGERGEVVLTVHDDAPGGARWR